jgi:hypothetical protein
MATRPNKDKRQRQNRQERAARQARSARAGEATAISRGEREAAAARAGDDTGGKGKARRGAAGDKGRGNRRRSPFAIPGQRAVVMAFLFTIVSAGTLLLAPVQVQREVDEGAAVLERIDEDDITDRDEEAGTVTYVEDVKLLDEEGAAVAAGVLLTPIIITGIAAWFTKRPQRSTAWTMALVALAGYIFFFAGPYGIITLPSLIALAVGGFQSRRVETKERLATLRAEKAARGDGEVIDVEATEAPADADGAPMADDDRR